MFFDPLDVPDELVEAQAQGRLVIFAGAGVSMGEPSNLPSFYKLAEEIAGAHPLGGRIHDYEAKLDYFLGELQRNGVDVEGLCRTIVGKPESQPTELHRSLADLFIKVDQVRIVTTNFDTHFRTVFNEAGKQPDCYFAPALPLGNRFNGIVYLHGLITRPEPLVLTDEGFGRAYLTEGWAREFLQRLFVEFTTLFVGYSHNDIPVEYLARGMSGRDLAPRFALTAKGKHAQWASLGIREIYFDESTGANSFKNLYEGMRRWVDFTRQQPTDIAERIREIVRAAENIAPDKSQTSLLRRCLARDSECHFFTSEAKGWHWVKWLQQHEFIAPLFDASLVNPTRCQSYLSGWLARELLAETTEEGLLLVEKYNGGLGKELWSRLCISLHAGENTDWNSKTIQKWVLLLIQTCPETEVGGLSLLLEDVTKAGSQSLGMALLRRLTRVRLILSEDLELQDSDYYVTAPKLEISVGIEGESHELERMWDECFKPKISESRGPLLLLLENTLRQAHEVQKATSQADAHFDPFWHRGRINERDIYRTDRGISLIVDFMLDILEHKEGGSLPEHQVAAWLVSDVPVLVRLGLYSLHLSNEIANPRKIELLQMHNLIFPAVFSAKHESWMVICECYRDINIEGKRALWEGINDGPNWTTVETERALNINNLTWLLATKNSDCSESRSALEGLKHREPKFVGHENLDQVYVMVDDPELDSPRTPKTPAQLFTASPAAQVDWMLEYRGGEGLLVESRAGLLFAVSSACAKDHAWGMQLLQVLSERRRMEGDLWDAAFWSINIADLTQENLTCWLKWLEMQPLDKINDQKLTIYLFHSVDFTEGKRPSKENIDLLIRLSLVIWMRVCATEGIVIKDFRSERLTEQAVSHPAGQLVTFWLKYCEFLRIEAGGVTPGFPDWLQKPLADMLTGAHYAGQIGRVALGMHLHFVYHFEPVWTSTHLFPKLLFSKVGEEALLMWHPFARHGQLSRDLILLMPHIYREAFSQLHIFDDPLRAGFIRHVALIVFESLFDVNENNWFSEFLGKTDEKGRVEWARQMARCLRDAPEGRNLLLWKRWLRQYWEDRLSGRPAVLSNGEAETMLGWAIALGSAFPDAVALVIKGPHAKQRFGSVLYSVQKTELPEKYPDALLHLLIWLLDDQNPEEIISRQVDEVLLRLPPKTRFVAGLDAICQRLTSLGYAGARDLRRQIGVRFNES